MNDKVNTVVIGKLIKEELHLKENSISLHP